MIGGACRVPTSLGCSKFSVDALILGSSLFYPKTFSN